jgi:hypothetical protein
MATRIIKEILDGIGSESNLINKFSNDVKEKELRFFITKLINVGAIDLK